MLCAIRQISPHSRYRAWSQTWNIHNLNKTFIRKTRHYEFRACFFQCTRDQMAIWLARIIWDGENHGISPKIPDPFSAAILLAEVVGWERDYPFICARAVSMEIGYIWKCKLNSLNMHVDQKLPYLYMCSNACMLAAKVCMSVAHVFQKLMI